MTRLDNRHFGWFLAACGATTALLVTAYVLSVMGGDSRPQFLAEDQLVENLTVALTVCAAIIATVHLLRSPRPLQPVAVTLAAVAFMFGLEELSFGERIFGFTTPTFLDIKLDSFHDLAQVVWKVMKTQLMDRPLVALVGITALGVVGIFVALSAAIAVNKTDWVARNWSNVPAGRYLATGLGLGVIGLLADFRSDNEAVFLLVEEATELLAGLAFAAGATTLFVRRSTADHRPRAGIGAAGPSRPWPTDPASGGGT